MLKKRYFNYLLLLCFVVSCDNEPYEGDFFVENNACLLARQETVEAAEDYQMATDTNYSVLCQNYKTALENQIASCGDEDGTTQAIINNLDTCAVIIDDCQEATMLTNIARLNYESADNFSFQDACNAYTTALQNQILVCGPDPMLQFIVDQLGDCESNVVDVVGTWKLISWNTDEVRDLNNDGITTSNYLDDIDCYDNETILFNSDATGTMFLRSTAEFTYTPNDGPDGGEDFFVACTDINNDEPFTWSETVNSVILNFNDGTSLSLFKNGNLYVAIDDAFSATSTVDDALITERITFVYVKL